MKKKTLEQHYRASSSSLFQLQRICHQDKKKRNIACGNVSEKEGLCFLHFTFDSNKVNAIKSTAVIIKTKWHWMNLDSQIKKPIPK